MKNLLCALIITLAFTSCSSDNDPLPQEQSTDKPIEQPVENKGEFVLDNTIHPVNFASVLTLDLPNNESTTQIYLRDVNYSTSEDYGISLTINHETLKNISGTYNLGNSREKKGVLDYILTSYVIVKKSSDGTLIMSSSGGDRANVKEGSVTIIENGNKNFTIKFNLLFDNGITASANTTVNATSNR